MIKLTTNWRAACMAVACLHASTVESAPSKKYVVTSVKVTDLGTLGGAQSAALDINDAGQIVGWAATAQGVSHAFFHSGGMMEDIGDAFGAAASDASGINNHGAVIGTMTDELGSKAFVWSAGYVSWREPWSMPLGTRGAAIADTGEAVGITIFGVGPSPTYWLSNGSPRLIRYVGYGEVHDLNSSGRAVGYKWEKFFPSLFVSAEGKTFLSGYVPAPDSTRGILKGDALGINERNDVVGYHSMPGLGNRAFLWDGVSKSSQLIGVLPTGTYSYADDINELRFIAGRADDRVVQYPFEVIRERAFLYHSDFGLYALPELPAATWLGSCRAFALNEWNSSASLIQVVGSCDTSTGSRAVRWDLTVRLVSIFFEPAP
jgi:probable HAF family extracellular repeat protein